MKIKVKIEDRKAFVAALASMLGCEKKYLGTPSYAYKVGQYTVERDCTIVPDDDVWNSQMENLIERLSESGYEIEKDEGAGLTIYYPKDDTFKCDDAEKLRKLLGSKAQLIKRALGINDITFDNTSDELVFRWFDRDVTAEEEKAYTHLVYALCEYAKERKYISGKKKEIENEKFEFRCFLIRLGFSGDKYIDERKVLMKNLKGNAAFKNGKPGKKAEISNEDAICEGFTIECELGDEPVVKTEIVAVLKNPERCACR